MAYLFLLLFAQTCINSQMCLSCKMWSYLSASGIRTSRIFSSQFGIQDYVGHFVLDAHEQYNASGIRVFEDPQDAGALNCKMPIGTYGVDNKVMLGNCCPLTLTDLWLYFQELLRSRKGHENAKVAALQLYSDKTLLTISNSLSAHPIRATLLNIAFGKRVQKFVWRRLPT